MGKQTKRARKFSATGGVQARLEKGTVTKKGKLKRKRKGDGNQGQSNKKMNMTNHDKDEAQREKREENDFAGEANLGDMDLESFFESFADKMETERQRNDVDSVSDDEDKEEEESEQGEKDSDDDDDDDESDSIDSDDDEDVDVATERMKCEMKKLHSSDPEFHKFLAENEKSLLEFGVDEQENEEDDEEDESVDDEDVSLPYPEKSDKSAYTVVDAKFLKKMEQGAFNAHGIKSLKKLVAAYKAACHLSDANQDEDGEKKSGSKKHHIESSEAFDKLMVMCLNKCHEEFDFYLVGKKQEGDDENAEDKEDQPLSSKIITRSPRWNEIKPIFQSFMKSTLHLLTEAKEPELLTFMLKALSKYVRFLTVFPRIAEALLKTLTGLWSAPLDSSEDYQIVRLNAFIRIRQLALTQPFPFIENCLKKTYLAYASRAKFGTSASVTALLPTLTFMGNCVVELYSLDYHSSYQHAFVYIRQLALHLRTAIQKKTPEALQAVYCWQYIHCLKLWVAVITASCKMDSDDGGRNDDDVKLLRSLIFPLSEVILGVVRLVPTARHLPLRLHCVRFLQQLAAAAQMFIPTTSILLEVLDLKEIGLRPKKIQGRGSARGIQLALILKLPKESPLRTLEQLEACVSEVFLLLNREVELYRYSAGFPEFSVAICQRLRKVSKIWLCFSLISNAASHPLAQFSKETKNMRWRAYCKGCIDVCDRYSAYAVKERAVLGEAPKDVKRLEVLKPTKELDMGARYDAAIAKEKRLEEVTRPVTKTEEQDTKNEEEEKEEKASKKSSKKGKKKMVVNEADLANTKVLEEDDALEEGIDWIDDEAGSSDEE